MGKEEEGMPNTCVRGCCSSTHIPLAIPKTHFNITKEIARGAESVVYEARLEGKLVAAKKPKLSTSADLDRFHEELQILSKVEHPNVATLVGVRAYPPDYFFFYHLYENGNLGDALHEADWRPTLQQILTIAIQLAKALQYLHKEGIVHRDVKPANILLDSNWGAHLGDFGLAIRAVDLKKPSEQNWKSTGKPTGGFHKKNMVGTLLYMAPEILRKDVQSEKSDVYGFGITINELLTGVVPYTDRKTAAQAHTVLEMNYSEQQLSAAVTSQGLRPVLADPESGVPPVLASLIQQCWEGDASLRPSFDKIVETLDAIIIPQPHVKTLLNNHEQQQTVPVDLQNNALDAILSYNLQQKRTEVNWAARAAKDWEPTSTQLLSVSPSWLTPSMDNSVYCPTLSMGSFATKGARQTMEDTHFVISQLGGADHVSVFGVFDGHRGPEAAEFAALAIPSFLSKSAALSPQEALMAAFTETDIVFRRELEMQRSQKKGTSGAQWHPGCTATTALLTGNKLFVANAGDCRTVLCRNGKAIQLSKDHTASCIEERERIISAGGHVSWQVDTWRVGAAALEVTRSIGDDDLKPFVTAEPELQECVLSADDEFLVIASDGLWEKLTNNDVVALVKDTVKEPSMVSKRLATESVERGSRDNITVIVVFLTPVSTVERVY
ncbi:hypothetical protein BDL97_02G202900 [Sphagnum fallax]|nr:hypothetical protein BDL97_02G202900 [Sphagnum fallax]